MAAGVTSGTLATDLTSVPHGPVRTVILTPHPETPADAVHGIRARLQRYTDGTLAVMYMIDGALDRLRIPRARQARVAERLWQHTCCEIFVRRGTAPAYHEFNFSPSGEWAAYSFDAYRDGARLQEDALDPQVTVRRTSVTLELDALVRLTRLSPMHAGDALSLSLTAVIEDRDGVLSYWALAHPPGKPDFHHRDAFVLELDEIRN